MNTQEEEDRTASAEKLGTDSERQSSPEGKRPEEAAPRGAAGLT